MVLHNNNNNNNNNNKKSLVSSFRCIFMHADRFDRFLMGLGFIGAVGDGLTMPAMFTVTSKLMNNLGVATTTSDSVGHDDFMNQMNQNALVLCYLAGALWVACFLEGYCWTRTAERQASRLRIQYLKAVLRQDVAYFDLHVDSVADVISSVSSDSLVIQEAISEKVPVLLMHLSTFIGSYVAGFLMLWKLVIVGIPFILFLVIPGLLYGKALVEISRKIREEYSTAGVIVEQAISSIRTVYSFVGETKTLEQYSAALERSADLGLKQGLAKGVAIGSNGVNLAIWAFICYYGSKLVMYHGAEGGTVFAVAADLTIGGFAVGNALTLMKRISEASAASEHVMEVMRRVPSIDSDDMRGRMIENVSGEVEFKDIRFAYPARPESMVLRDFSLKIPAGMTVALVGESGSGKSTAIALLQRFYDPLWGEILLDGVAIDKLQIKWLRSQMGVVSQEPALFATSIKENILFGKEDASMEQIIEAAKIANAHTFISQLPHGYDNQVGERGVQMSGGQKQRIAIARAIIKSPRILLLDEATSALDSESERVVQEALEKAATGRTTIVISHRLSTICNADIIAVVQNGKVIEIGSHNELMEKENGMYALLVRLRETEKPKQVVSGSQLISSTEIHTTSNQFPQTYEASETAPVSKDNQPSFRRLLALNLPEWKQATLGCISSMLFGAIQPVHTFILGSMISVYFLPDHSEMKEKIKVYSFCFLGMSAFWFLTSVVQHYNFSAMGEYLTKRVRERLLSKMLTFEIGWYDKDENATGAICSRLAKDANVVRSLVGDRLSLLCQIISAVTTCSIIGLVIAWRYAVVMLAVQPLIMVCYYFKKLMLKKMCKKAMKAQCESSKLAAEAVSNLRTVTAFSSQARILGMLENAQKGPMKESIRQAWFAGIVLATSNAIMTLNTALSFWYGGKLVARGYIQAKAFFQTFMVVISSGPVIVDTGAMVNDLVKGAEAVGSVFAILDKHSLIEPDDPECYKPDKIKGHIELCDIHFAYPARPDVMVFNGLSLDIEAGKSTALVGQSGSGKSTIIGLIERFCDPINGAVKIDGQDIQTYNLRSLRTHIALVSQEPAWFAGTIRENITYGRQPWQVDEAEIIESAKMANAHDFIAALKNGYDTWCGDKGLQLSGGQKQRIAIARAILKNPSILLLDEATSALDSQSEKVVQEALERVMVGKTSVVVAHRLSTIQNCDAIAVLEKGKVVEKGTHFSLLAMGPKSAYYSLISLQTSH